MKKIVSILLCALMVLSVFPVLAGAETLATPTITADKTEVKVGDTVTMTVALTGSTGVTSVDFTLKYDPTELEFQSANDGEALTAIINGDTEEAKAAGEVYFSGATAKAVTGDAVLFTTVFKALKEVASLKVKGTDIEIGLLSDGKTVQSDLPATVESAPIKVNPASGSDEPPVDPPVDPPVVSDEVAADLSVTPAKAAEGDTITVTAKMTKNTGITSLDYELVYDKDALECTAYTAGEIIAGPVINDIGGQIFVSVAAAGESTKTGTILTATFKVKEVAATRQIAFTGSGTAGLVRDGKSSELPLAEDIKRVTLTEKELPPEEDPLVKNHVDPTTVSVKKPTEVQSGTYTVVELGKVYQMEVILTPEKACDNIWWKTSSKKIATITGCGILVPKKVGKATLTVTTCNGKKAKLKIKVINPKTPTKITLDKTGTIDLPVGQTLQLNATMEPATAESTLKWTSSKKGYATVDANGLVTAKKKGTTTITVKTKNKKAAKVKIKVVP